MNDTYRARLEGYLAAMLQAKRMLSMGILTRKITLKLIQFLPENTAYLR